MHNCPKLTIKEECIGREMCGWNDTTNKCRKKSIRKLKNLNPKEVKCPNFTLQKECITNESCGWNDITNKCRKKSIRKLKYIEEKAEIQKKPENGFNGIHIGDTIVNRISGPSSIYYLKPSKQVTAANLHFFPSVMLFGDEHFSKKNAC
jgi:hypothetical protein